MNKLQLTALVAIFGSRAKVTDFEFSQGIPCFDSNQAQGQQSHKSGNGIAFNYKGLTGYITTTGLTVKTVLSDAGRILSQSIIPFGGSMNSLSHRTFMASHYPRGY